MPTWKILAWGAFWGVLAYVLTTPDGLQKLAHGVAGLL